MIAEPNPKTWARQEAARLRAFQISQNPHVSASSGDLAPGIDFLRKFAGADSAFTFAANDIAERGPYRAWSHSHRLADLLENWATWSESGFAFSQPFEVRSRIAAATDLMDFVAELLNDRSAHPAAPIVLAGAALEERLRAMLDESHTEVSRSGLDAYGAALKKEQVITSVEAKQIISWAGLRNQAAHGQDLDSLTMQQAQLMADGINFFLQVHDVNDSPE